MSAAERLPADNDGRVAIRQQLDVTMMVEAAAGTGKTTRLVDRMVALIRTGRCGVETLAAITFTVKAAAQLRERFQEGLEKAVATAGGEERQRLTRAIEHLERCFIGTTHAFCARLLRERPVEAGIDPDFEELDETASRFLTNQFWERWVEHAAAKGDPKLGALRDAGIQLKVLKDFFHKLTGFPDVVVVFKEVPPPDLDAAFEAVWQLLDEIEPHFQAVTKRDKGFEKLIERLLQSRHTGDFDEAPARADFLDEADHASNRAVQKNWADAKTAKAFGAQYSEMILTKVRPTLRQWREYVHGLSMAFLEPAVSEFADERQRNGTLTFEDLLLCARDLLRDHPSVRSYFQKRFTHLLVDEFQDTDPLQAEVMFYLTGIELEEKKWRRLTPRPGSLFIVGDPKQSIYRFRRADITTYIDVRDRIEATKGTVLQLSTNFRSLPAICDWVNANFKTMFSGAEVDAKRQAPHVEMVAHYAATVIAGAYILETPGGTNQDVADAEAACLAKWIGNAMHGEMKIDDEGSVRPAQWKDFLLVSWNRPRLSAYARALEVAGIPYEITGGRAFAKSEELTALLPILRCVLDPTDAVSLAAYLRGPLCGVDDQALYDFARAGGRFSLYTELPEATDPRIVAGFELLRTTVTESHQLPPGATLARLFERLGVIALAGTQERGGTRSGNLMLALSYARKVSSRGESLAEVASELEDLVGPGSEVEELDIDPVRENAVRLMNLHQVKGLEAPIVFLIDPANPPEHAPDVFIDRTGDESLGFFAILKKVFYDWKPVAVPQGWDALQKQEESFKAAEDKRLLYVAATRAKNMLVVGVQRRMTQKGDWLAGAWGRFARLPADPLFPLDEGQDSAPSHPEAAFEFEAARNAIAASYDHARAASYSVLPVTRLAHRNHAELLMYEEGLGKGTSWGRVMHRLLEAMLRNPRVNVQLYAENLLKDEERDAAELSEVLATIRAVEASDLWKRAKQSPQVLVEVPFALNVRAADLGLDEPGDTLLHGTVDLVFREGNEWIVVDYKSDVTAGRLDNLVAYYRPQVEHYARFWTQLTGEPSRPGLFFIDGTREVWL